MDPLALALAVAVAAALLVSAGVVYRLDPGVRRLTDRLRARFVLGVPWGTLVVVAVVLAVYLFVQDGLSEFGNPVVLPYRAWSYSYPLGMLASAFSHANSSHLIGNLAGTVAVAPIAEYAWGHYPPSRTASGRPASWRSDPRVRAFVLFPAAVIAVGVFSSLFAIGPVIGFSGVVYALGGFALVRYPVATLVSFVAVQGTLTTIYRALSSPVLVAQAQPSGPSAPWWATIAIQGHGLGLLLGFVVAAALFHRRGYRPDPGRFWAALVLYGFAQSLWAIYWFRGNQTYVLFRGPGVVVVAALALVVTVAVAGPDRPLLPDRAGLPWRSTREADASGPRLRRVLELAAPGDSSAGDRPAVDRIRDLAGAGRPRGPLVSGTRRGAAFLALVFVLAAISAPAVPVNLFSVADDPASSEATVAVGDYSISYAEDVENELVGVVDVELFGEDTTVRTSGVIVSSERRDIWTDAVSAGQLAFDGRATVTVGGPGWRESVTAIRRGWIPVGNDTVYQVWLRPEGESARHAFASEPAAAAAVVDGRTVGVVADDGSFLLEVRSENDRTRVGIPQEGERVAAGGLEFERERGVIYASVGETVVPVASREEYGP